MFEIKVPIASSPYPMNLLDLTLVCSENGLALFNSCKHFELADVHRIHGQWVIRENHEIGEISAASSGPMISSYQSPQ